MGTTQPIRNDEQLKLFKEYYLHEKPNPRNYALIIMGLNSALRISDILELTYGNVYDFKNKQWKSHIMVREQKTGKANCIYINHEIQATLENYIDLSKEAPSDWLFGSQMQKDRPLSRYQAYRVIKQAAAFAGLDSDISCHSLRKTFGYHAWKQGTPLPLLVDIYNHSTYQVTRRYLGIDQDDRDMVFKKIKI